jgi:hypothetical protein
MLVTVAWAGAAVAKINVTATTNARIAVDFFMINLSKGVELIK